MTPFFIAVGLTVVVLALIVCVISILELRKDTNDQRAFIDKQNELIRKGLERANYENKPK